MDEKRRKELLALYADMLTMDSAPMRRVAVWELGRLADPGGAEHVMRAIAGDPDWECRHYAIMALANVGRPEDAVELRRLIEDGYLSQEGRDEAGPPPEGLVEHMLEDLDYAMKCSKGEVPRPSEDDGKHGEWWRGG